ncbi:hypothetical protein ACLB2K_013448 [Fragaria x ananassa]
MATMAMLWELKGKLQIRSQGERYVLRFNDVESRKHIVEGGSWFYGKTMFALALYDGRKNVTLVLIKTISVWVEVFGLPPDLMTKEALYMVGKHCTWWVRHLAGSSTMTTRTFSRLAS